jgi:hypothetical protein
VSVPPGSSTSQNWSLLRSALSVTPGHQFVEPGDLVIGDAAEPVKSQFFLPMAIPRMPLSAVLLSISRMP